MSSLDFDDKKHEYSVNGKKLQSVTTFVKTFFKPFDVGKVSKLVAKARRAKGEKNKKGKPINAWDVRREWKASATFGTKVHAEIEKYIGRGVPPEEQKAVQAITWLQLSPYINHNLLSEVKVYNREIGLAGTIDLLAEDNNTVTLIDWKTNKKIRKDGVKRRLNEVSMKVKDCNYIHYTLQLSLYAYLLELEGYNIDKLLLVHLGEYINVYEIEYRKDLVKLMLELSNGGENDETTE